MPATAEILRLRYAALRMTQSLALRQLSVTYKKTPPVYTRGVSTNKLFYAYALAASAPAAAIRFSALPATNQPIWPAL